MPYQPAPVYTNTKPVSLHTEQSAGTSSIGVSDLAPPPKTQTKPESSNLSKPSNPWTGKTRDAAEAGLKDRKPEALQLAQPSSPAPAAPAQSAVARKQGTFMWPVASHKVLSGFGPKGGGKSNDGINIASPDNEPVWASADGEVVYVGDMQGYGNMILIKHPGGKTTGYAHLGRATVDKYDRVKQGDIIGYVGNTGGVKKPQLFFSMRDGQTPVDPKKYLSTSLAGL